MGSRPNTNSKMLNLSSETLVSKNDNYRHKERDQDQRSYDSSYGRHAGVFSSPQLPASAGVVASNKLLASIPASRSILKTLLIVTT